MSNTQPAPLAGAATTSSVVDKTSTPGTVVAFPVPCATVGELIDAYMEQYAGRDPACGYRLSVWQAKLGLLAVAELSDDHFFNALEQLAAEPARYYVGNDADGRGYSSHQGQAIARDPFCATTAHSLPCSPGGSASAGSRRASKILAARLPVRPAAAASCASCPIRNVPDCWPHAAHRSGRACMRSSCWH